MSALSDAWRAFTAHLTLHKVEFLPGTSEEPDAGREVVSILADANVFSSPRTDAPGHHAVLLDLDVPAWLIESSTPGHSHLYADVRCTWDDYLTFLKAAAAIGLIEPGYAQVVEQRGYSSVRLPWVKKAPLSGLST